MSVDDTATGLAAVELGSAVRELLTGLLTTPWGQVSPSIYETGRLVALAPWLRGHRERVEFLMAAQRPDGGWGAREGYALVPTLSAVEAILTVVHQTPLHDTRPTSAAARGLEMLRRLIPRLSAADIPDMPAIDLTVAYLINSINQRLESGHLELPAGMDGTRLGMVHAAIGSGIELPDKLLHALEVAGPAARGLRTARAGTTGTIGASPAATAAWLGDQEAAQPGNRARLFLETVVEQHDGPVPCGIPITLFERAWVVAVLGGAGLATDVPGEVVASLKAALNSGGTAAGEGLPQDADTTSVALYALGLVGEPYRPDVLWEYYTGTHFCTWQGEDGFSVTVNAHVLEAFGQFTRSVPQHDPRYAATVADLSALLVDQQSPDGSWQDRWHASPFYATMCCALALARFGGATSADAVAKAARWVLSSQRPDGSWGRWDGTAEETAYAIRILLSGPMPAEPYRSAATLGLHHLLEAAAAPAAAAPPLWHDKDLYAPGAIVRANVLAALHVARRELPGFGTVNSEKDAKIPQNGTQYPM